MDTQQEEDPSRASAVRALARVLGGIVAVLLTCFGVGEDLEGRSRGAADHPLDPVAAIGLGLLVAYVAALFLAFKWERVGALLGTASLGSIYVMLLMGAFVPQGGMGAEAMWNPLMLALWLPIALYLGCWILDARERTRVVRQDGNLSQ